MAESADLQAAFEALHASGAAARHPVRFAYLDALARRAVGQPEPIRQRLNARISAAAGELAARPVIPAAVISQENAASALAELLVYISQHAHEHPEAAQPSTENASAQRTIQQNSQNASAGRPRQGPELKSVAYFRNTWSKLSTEQHLTQTLAQAPENAGPMNSQHLVLRSLQIMRDIAPDYLQGFMSYIDTLIWLEHADPTKLSTGRASSGKGENKKARTTKHGATNR
ncbi:MAG: DUF2894 domain-containing protein [Bacteroidota bacterium]